MKRVTLWTAGGLLFLLCATTAWSQTASDRPVDFDHGIPVFQLPAITVTPAPGRARVAERDNDRYTAAPGDRISAPGEKQTDLETADNGGQTRYVRMHVMDR